MSDEGYSGDDLVQDSKSSKSLSTGVYAKKKLVDRSVLDLALERLNDCYKLFDTLAVSFSGGKDSTVCLHLTLEVARARGQRVIAFFYDEEAIPYDTEHYVRRCTVLPGVEVRWYCLPIQHRNGCSRREPFWYPWGPEVEAKWVRPLPPEAITAGAVPGFPRATAARPTMPESVPLIFDALDYGRVGMVMGIRANESLARTRAVLHRHRDTRPYVRPWADNLWKVYPIYDWSTADVWTYPKQFKLDYNRAYDAMEMAGVSRNAQRCAPPYGEEPMQNLWMYSVCFPDIWDKMSNRVPGSATAARYSTTELYAFSALPSKPGNFTWPNWVRYWIAKHPQPYRSQIASRVQNWVRNHYGKTSDPIAPTVPHPDTGVSWRFLLMIAMRGDYKGRKQPVRPFRQEAEMKKAWEHYRKELAT